jgi:alkane 1-monooxygenase
MPSLIYPLSLGILLLQGPWLGWLLVAFNIAAVPAVDHLLRAWRPGWQVPDAVRRFCFAAPWFWLYALAQLIVLLGALYVAAEASLGWFGFMGLASGIGIMTGTGGITAAHELIHRRRRSERGLGLALLAMASYLHFRIQHVEGHHRYVGTDDDPVSARRGERFPAFFLRVLWQGPRQAWRLERHRLAARRLPLLSWHNRLLHYLLLQVCVYGVVAFAFGVVGLGIFLLQSLIAIHLLEAVNYVQHYGLRRVAGEPVGEHHAWESDDALSPLLVFHLSRHAVHHRQPEARGRELPLSATAPRLPFSFFLMVFLALIPPLWARVMDPRLQGWLSGRARPVQDRKPPSTVSVVPVT